VCEVERGLLLRAELDPERQCREPFSYNCIVTAMQRNNVSRCAVRLCQLSGRRSALLACMFDAARTGKVRPMCWPSFDSERREVNHHAGILTPATGTPDPIHRRVLTHMVKAFALPHGGAYRQS